MAESMNLNKSCLFCQNSFSLPANEAFDDGTVSKPLSWWTGDAAEEAQDEQSSADRAITQAAKWIGYIEKASDKNLDDFTANPGYSNFTRFGRDYADYMGEGTRNMEWCAAFVSCVFAYEFGLAEAKRLLSGNLHCYTPYGATLMNKRAPQSPCFSYGAKERT
jgi:hypothetical protein